MTPTCRLDELALKHGTDKSSVNHNYCPWYEKHLPEKINSLLEIGCWKGASIKMFKEWYNNEGNFYAMDIFGGEVISQTELASIGVRSYMGSQSDMNVLSKIKEQFDVITEDGSHHSYEQVFTFLHMFKHNVASGGWYIIEDLCCCTDPYWWRNDTVGVENTALGIFKAYLEGRNLVSQNVTQEQNDIIMPLIESVHLYNDNIVFIKKKSDA
jgi:hypothetical protein